MGVDARDWNRAEPEGPSRASLVPGLLVVLAVVAGLGLALGARHVLRGDEPTFEVARGKPGPVPAPPCCRACRRRGCIAIRCTLPNDRWTAYLADERTCPGGERTDLPLDRQANVMACLVDFARRQRGLAPLTTVDVLNGSSLAKTNRVVRCQAFAHAACGDDPASDARTAGYHGPFGENLYLADGRLGAPRVALDGWLNSPGHRTNLFRPQWRFQGIAVQRIERFGQYRDATLWVHQFGAP